MRPLTSALGGLAALCLLACAVAVPQPAAAQACGTVTAPNTRGTTANTQLEQLKNICDRLLALENPTEPTSVLEQNLSQVTTAEGGTGTKALGLAVRDKIAGAWRLLSGTADGKLLTQEGCDDGNAWGYISPSGGTNFTADTSVTLQNATANKVNKIPWLSISNGTGGALTFYVSQSSTANTNVLWRDTLAAGTRLEIRPRPFIRTTGSNQSLYIFSTATANSGVMVNVKGCKE